MTDPMAIDLETSRRRLHKSNAWPEIKPLIAAVEALRERVKRLKADKRAPVQGYSAGIPWSMHLRAYDGYCKKYGPQPALVDLEKRNCRGGFGTGELDEFIPGWREELSETVQLLQRAETAEAREVELAAALKWALPLASLELENVRQIRLQAGHSDIGRDTKRPGLWPKEQEAECCARTALAPTPANALERARARDEVVKQTRIHCDIVPAWNSGNMRTALAKLDVLTPEEEE